MDFDERLEKYAELIVKTGVNVQKGQPVILYISVDQAKLARLIVAKAYETGAGRVFVKWRDDFINRKFIENASDEFLNDMPDWENGSQTKRRPESRSSQVIPTLFPASIPNEWPLGTKLATMRSNR